MVINSWTSEGMDWTNPNPADKKYLEAIILALNERCEKAFKTTGSYGNYSGYRPVSMSLLDNCKYFSDDLCLTIWAKLQALFPVYLNTAINGRVGYARVYFPTSYTNYGWPTPTSIVGEDHEASSSYYQPYYPKEMFDGYDVPVANGVLEINYVEETQYHKPSRHVLTLTLPEIKYERFGDLRFALPFSFSAWNTEDMLAYIGAERTESNIVPVNMKAWMIQMYKIINALEYVIDSISNPVSYQVYIPGTLGAEDFFYDEYNALGYAGSELGRNYNQVIDLYCSQRIHNWRDTNIDPDQTGPDATFWVQLRKRPTATCTFAGTGYFGRVETVFELHVESIQRVAAYYALMSTNTTDLAEFSCADGAENSYVLIEATGANGLVVTTEFNATAPVPAFTAQYKPQTGFPEPSTTVYDNEDHTYWHKGIGWGVLFDQWALERNRFSALVDISEDLNFKVNI